MNRTDLMKGVMGWMHRLGVHSLAPESISGVGVIFMLHRVRQQPLPEFAPNRILEITPQFLQEVIQLCTQLGYDIVPLDEAVRRMEERDHSRRFAVFTLDDGYEDNLTTALPVFEQHDVPFTMYLNSGMADQTCELWWLGLERVIKQASRLEFTLEGKDYDLLCMTPEEKDRAYSTVYWPLRRQDEDTIRSFVRQLALQQNFDLIDITREVSLSWDQVRQMHQHPLVTLGSHTSRHYALAKMQEMDARDQIMECNRRMMEELGEMPIHFAYPYGDAGSAGERDFEMIRQMGFRSAVTTRKGLLQEEHGTRMTALPRLSLNGDFQDLRFIEVLLSGVPFAMARAIPSLGAA